MYIYHALIKALRAHMIHINLNMIFYNMYHVEHIPSKTIYIKYYTDAYERTPLSPSKIPHSVQARNARFPSL